MFDDEEQLQYCMGVAEEAKEVLQAKVEEKRKLAKKEGKTSIEEDDPVKVLHGIVSAEGTGLCLSMAFLTCLWLPHVIRHFWPTVSHQSG
jgi:hypothetical protein